MIILVLIMEDSPEKEGHAQCAECLRRRNEVATLKSKLTALEFSYTEFSETSKELERVLQEEVSLSTSLVFSLLVLLASLKSKIWSQLFFAVFLRIQY